MLTKKMHFTIPILCILAAVLALAAGGDPAQARPPVQKPDPPVQAASTPDHPSGGPLGTWWFLISPLHVHDEPDETYSAVAYNSQQQEYLVVWERDYSGGTKEIYGQRVSKNGALVGSCISIAAPGGIYQHPDVAYNSQLNQYLVVWVAGAVGVYGQRISATGGLVSSRITIADDYGYLFGHPAVAHAPGGDSYLVVFERDSGSYWHGVRARRVFNDGTTDSSALDVAPLSDTTSPGQPDLAYNAARSEILVVWQQLVGGTYDIYGQRVHMLAGGGYHAEGLTFPILNFVKDLKNPAVAALRQPAGVGQYLMVSQYEYSPTDRDIYAQRVAGDGTLTGSYLAITTSTADETVPAVANSGSAQEYLVAWREGGTLASIQARTVSQGGGMGTNTLLYGWYSDRPAVAGGPGGDYLVTDEDFWEHYEILGWLWGNRVYLPTVLRQSP